MQVCFNIKYNLKQLAGHPTRGEGLSNLPEILVNLPKIQESLQRYTQLLSQEKTEELYIFDILNKIHAEVLCYLSDIKGTVQINQTIGNVTYPLYTCQNCFFSTNGILKELNEVNARELKEFFKKE